MSRDTTGELIRALAYPKFQLSPADQRELLAEYLPCCTVVALPARAPAVPACRDPGDVPFLVLAAVGKADFLVTGDRDLLDLPMGSPCGVVTPVAFLAVLG